MRILLHLRAVEPVDPSDDRRGGLARYVSHLLVQGWRTDLPGGSDPVYSFSNIFPPGEVQIGDRRRLLIASPNPDLIRALSRRLRQEDDLLRAHGMAFRVERHETFSVQIERAGVHMTTATPILLRVPSPDGRGRVFWSPPMFQETFIAALNLDMVRRFNAHHATHIDEETRIIAGGVLQRVTRSGRIPSSYWEFRTERLNAPAQRVLAFCIDAGFGERVRQGFGFVNVSREARAEKKSDDRATTPDPRSVQGL